MSEEVSQLERAPDSLRSAVDPTLEAAQQQLSQLQENEGHEDHMLQHSDVQSLAYDGLDQVQAPLDMDDYSSPENHEPFSPRRGFTHKRHEEPPRNQHGKMMCKFTSTCPNLLFDRRCEWSKHMDKHDRPYKCAETGCEKLQGFTYSGGLLRHQREVHKMHGGTKKPMYCPEPNCKRNAGTGFTRKENLSEHIRRVHRRATDDSDIAAQAQNGLDQIEAAAAAAAAVEDVDLTDGERAAKRKRIDPTLNSDFNDFNIESESVRRLKSENQDLKDRMKQMEENMAQQQSLLEQVLQRQQIPAPAASSMVMS